MRSLYLDAVWRSVTVLPADFTIQRRQGSPLLPFDATFAEKLIKDTQHGLEKHPKQSTLRLWSLTPRGEVWS